MPSASMSNIDTDETASNTASESPITHHNDKDALSTITSDGDSSFYGGQQLKRKYELKARQIDVEVEREMDWRVHEWNLQVLAARAVKKDPTLWPIRTRKENQTVGSKVKPGKKDVDIVDRGLKHQKATDSNEGRKKRKIDHETENDNADTQTTDPPLKIPPKLTNSLFNPYEGRTDALQINESLSTFLTRLKPSMSIHQTPWIYCANFHSDVRLTTPDIASFKQIGHRLLDKIGAKRRELESKLDPPKAEGAITRMMASDRASLEADIMDAAKKHCVTSGKWMLFPTREKVDRYWETVVRETVDGRLGTAAKVATRPEKAEEETQVIYVYTKDITDRADIKRVLLELVRLKLAAPVFETGQGSKKGYVKGQIWYKPDCYTWLDITSGNEYKIRPTLYGTTALLTGDDARRLGV